MTSVEYVSRDEFAVGTKPRAWNLSKIVANEVFLDFLVQSQGSNQAQFLERLEKNQRTARTQAMVIKAVYAMMFCFLTAVPVLALIQVSDYAQKGSAAPGTILFAAGFTIGLYFVLEFVYLLVLGVINLSSLFSGDSFKWLETLPISQPIRQKVCLLAAFRSFDAGLVSLVLAFPVLVAILKGSPLLVLACAFVSFLNTVISFSLLVLIAERFGRFTRANERTTRRGNILRTASMIGYMIAAFSIGIIVNMATTSVEAIFAALTQLGDIAAWNALFSLVPYPFAPGYLVAAVAMDPNSIPLTDWVSIFAGAGLLALLAWRAYVRAVKTLRGVVVAGETGAGAISAQVAETVDISKIFAPRTPVQAFRHKDLSTASRDMQAMTFLMMPIILPFVSLVPYLIATGNGSVETAGSFIFTIWIIMALISIIGATGLMSGLLNMETTGASLLASLPIVTRDQAKAKLSIMLPLEVVGFVAPVLLFVANPAFPQLFLTILTSIPYITFLLLASFLLKVRLFGRLKYKYVLEEVRMEHKTLKWLLIILMDGGIWALVAFPAFEFLQNLAFLPFLVIVLIVSIAGLGVCASIFNRMLPPAKEPAK